MTAGIEVRGMKDPIQLTAQVGRARSAHAYFLEHQSLHIFVAGLIVLCERGGNIGELYCLLARLQINRSYSRKGDSFVRKMSPQQILERFEELKSNEAHANSDFELHVGANCGYVALIVPNKSSARAS